MTFPDFRACTYNARWSRFIIILYCYILVCDYLFLLDIIQLFAFSHFKEKKYPVPLTTVLWPKFRSYNIIPPVVFRLVRNFFFYYFFFYLLNLSFCLSDQYVVRVQDIYNSYLSLLPTSIAKVEKNRNNNDNNNKIYITRARYCRLESWSQY